MTLDCEKSSERTTVKGHFFWPEKGRKIRGPESRPNKYSISQIKSSVNILLLENVLFVGMYHLTGTFLGIFPYCKRDKAVVFYRYKDSSSKEEKDGPFLIIFRLNKFVVPTK